jgi:hypothetical protein
MVSSKTYINQQLGGGRETLAKQNEITNEDHTGSVTAEITDSKKAFVEPAISAPVDVLEATTFFQVSTSGATN